MSFPPLIDLRTGFWPVVHYIRPCSLFPIDNLSIYAQNFFKFCIHIVIGDEWYGIVNGQNPTIFDGVTALSPFKKCFLACFSFTVYDIWMKLHRYVEQQRLHITTKDRHSYLSSSWVICPWLILSISVLLLFRHYISHKITFGAPSSGGVLCSACGAFIYAFLSADFFFKIVFFEKFFQDCHQSVKQFGSRSADDTCRQWVKFFSCSLLACDIGCTRELMLDIDKLGASLDNLPFNLSDPNISVIYWCMYLLFSSSLWYRMYTWVNVGYG